jgi:hypothetical protein
MLKGKGIGWDIWFSGVGTTRGAGSRPLLALRAECRVGIVSISVSCRRDLAGGGGGARAASATGSTVSASPSKKRVIAICVFHWHFCSNGTAAARSWSVTEVYCCSASCCSSLRVEISKSAMTTIDRGEREPCLVEGELRHRSCWL